FWDSIRDLFACLLEFDTSSHQIFDSCWYLKKILFGTIGSMQEEEEEELIHTKLLGIYALFCCIGSVLVIENSCQAGIIHVQIH
ncbi:hypothetical protein ACJX0J_024769, partial [Zea mays]